MNTKKLQLKTTSKAVMIAVLLCAVGLAKVANAQSLNSWELEQPFLFYLVYDDVQAWVTKMPDGDNSHAIREEQLPVRSDQIGNWSYNTNLDRGWVGLAKNEREGFQVFYREHEKSRNLRVEVTPFLNAQNDTLKHTIYYEEFFRIDTIRTGNPSNDLLPIDDSLAEALVPYFGEPKVTQINYNKMFYIELVSKKDQSPGEYVDTIKLYEGEELLASKPMTAKVWNFALPEGHYSEVVMGLYNRNSNYKSTNTFLTLNGIQVDSNGNVAPEDLEEAKRILNGYQNCLLEHGISTYEIPRWLMEDDPKEAELTMADPRRKVFTVPVLYGDLNDSGSDFKSQAQQVLQQYKDIVYDNLFLKDKAFFYPYDEPEDANDFAAIDQFCTVLSNYWPGYHATVPFYSEYYSTVEAFEGKIDILCPSHGFFNPKMNFSNATIAEQRLRDYMDLPHKWWKPDNPQIGGLDFFVDITGSTGVIRRILFWQQYLAHSDGLLYWNCAFLPNNWEKKHMPLPEGIRNGNGDGILLYPGTMFGQDAATPVVSLRLKQLAAGIDDYDYMRLVEEFLGEQKVWLYLDRAFDFGNHNFPNTLCGAWNRLLQVYRGYTCHPTQISRWHFGRILDAAANTEHDWGEWQTAVLPDETHWGLEIRTCDSCGAQESRPKTFLYRFLGTEDNQWSNLANWEYQPESLPVLGEAVIIASDCEIDSSQTVSSVIVKNGFNLTIKEGATLTSRIVNTEENAQIIIEDGGQLVHNSEGVMATMKKSVSGHGADDDGYVFISSPVADNTDPSQVNGLLTDNYDFYRFDAAASDGLEWRNYKTSTFNMTNGSGYLYANADETELNFMGTVKASNTPEIKMPTFSEGYLFGGWNLMGNPFTCNAYLNSDAEGMAFYRMNAEGNDCEAATDVIHPMEGFFVQATDAGQTFTIGREQPEGTRNELHLQIVQNVDNREAQHALDNAIIRFGKGNTLEKLSFREHKAKLYIPLEGKHYAVVNTDRQGELPLSFKVAEDGNYTLSFSVEGVDFSYLHLIDNQTGTHVDLLKTLNYSFDAKVTDNENRFKMIYSINTTK